MQTLGIYKLRTQTQHYDWGSTTFFSNLRGEAEPSSEPEAELWVGVHPRGASQVQLAGLTMPLSDLVDASPAEVLGDKVVDQFGDRLPFLLKILAVEKPLSIQLHPDRVQARHGFDREERTRVPADVRNYVDDRHKPEIAVALTKFSALRGLRSVPEIVEAFERAEVRSLRPILVELDDSPDEAGLRRFLESIFLLEEEAVASALKEVRRATVNNEGDPVFDWISRLLEVHPTDVGCLAPLFMNLEVLEPGEAVFQPPGMLHCYLEGAAVEVMADSDNVLRAAITSKHADVRELLKVLVVFPFDSHPVEAHQLEEHLWMYHPPAEEFNLTRLRLQPGSRFTARWGRSVELWVCTEGSGRMWTEDGPFSVEFSGGDALLVPAAVDAYSVEGDGCLYFAGVP